MAAETRTIIKINIGMGSRSSVQTRFGGRRASTVYWRETGNPTLWARRDIATRDVWYAFATPVPVLTCLPSTKT